MKKLEKKYPYEVFVRDELPNLDSKSKKEYQRLYKLAENIEPLAFYLYKTRYWPKKQWKASCWLTKNTVKCMMSLIWKTKINLYRERSKRIRK